MIFPMETSIYRWFSYGNLHFPHNFPWLSPANPPFWTCNGHPSPGIALPRTPPARHSTTPHAGH
jgi:hypothetical protein